MKKQCIQSVENVIGRSLTVAEKNFIVNKLSPNNKGAVDSLTAQGIPVNTHTMLQETARLAAIDLVREAKLKKYRLALQIKAHDQLEAFQAAHPKGRLDAINRILQTHSDSAANVFSQDNRFTATRDASLGQMLNTLEATNPRFFGLISDPRGEFAIIQELRGENSGSQIARDGAKSFRDQAEALRMQFNRAGGSIAKLDDWYQPNPLSALPVAKSARENPGQFEADHLGWVDRSRYVKEDGNVMNDTELTAFLAAAKDTIATEGATKITPGQYIGKGSAANAGREHRQIHYKDAASYEAAMKKYGERGFYQILTDHIASMARDIALLETWGPNADASYSFFRATALKEAKLSDPERSGAFETRATQLDALYDERAGRRRPTVRNWKTVTGDVMRDVTNYKLAFAVISSMTDSATLHISSHVNNLSSLRVLRREAAALNPLNKSEENFANRNGIGLETMIAELNRFGQETLGSSFSSKLSTAFIRSTGLVAFGAGKKRGFAIEMMDSIGSLVSTRALSDLHPSDNRILLSKGITEQDWSVWQRATLESFTGSKTILTPESIMRIPDDVLSGIPGDPQALRTEAMKKLLGAVASEADIAVVTPGIADRLLLKNAISTPNEGTVGGVLVNSVKQFKSFPVAFIRRQFMRGWGMPTAGGKAIYIASLVAATTVMGALVIQTKELLKGNNPRPVNDPRFWISAMLQGGGLGIYGDFLFGKTNRADANAFVSLLGPVASGINSFMNLTAGNISQAADGKPTNFGPEAVKFIQGYAPSPWYTKAVTDHLIFQQLQDYLSPNYLAKARKRAERQYGITAWWETGDALPKQPPDLSKAIQP